MSAPWTPVTVLFFFLLASISGFAEDQRAEDPHLETSSVYGMLDMGRPTTIAIVLHNNASNPAEINGLGLNPASFIDIVAELESDDDKIRVLSGPQMAGSLAPGENKTVEFVALTESAGVGVYPVHLQLSYYRLVQVAASGDENAPDLVFEYERFSEELPLPVKVVRGPEIELKELKGEAVPGEETSLELVIVNNGDQPALDLRLDARSMPPFLQVENEMGRAGNLDPAEQADASEQGEQDEQEEQINLDPGSTSSMRLAVFTDANATPGYSPLPCRISYLDPSQGHGIDQIDQASRRRAQDLAVLVMVQDDASPVTMQILLAGLMLLLLAGAYFGLKIFRNQGRKRKPHRTLRG